MRALKFRAFDYDEGYYSYSGDIMDMDNDNDEGWFSMAKRMIGFHGVVEQTTGLVDKNGKEIYEGDTVRAWIYYGNGDIAENVFTVEIGPHGPNLQRWTFEKPGYLPEVIGHINSDKEIDDEV